MEGETRKKVLQGRKVLGSLRNRMKGRTVNMKIKKTLRDNIIATTLTHAMRHGHGM